MENVLMETKKCSPKNYVCCLIPHLVVYLYISATVRLHASVCAFGHLSPSCLSDSLDS